MDVAPPGLPCPWVSQASILEWVAISSSSRSSQQPRGRTHVDCIGRLSALERPGKPFLPPHSVTIPSVLGPRLPPYGVTAPPVLGPPVWGRCVLWEYRQWHRQPLGAPSSARLRAAARPANILKCPFLCGVGFPRDSHLRQPGAPCTREAHTCQPSAAALEASVSSPEAPPPNAVLRTGPRRPGTHSLSAERGAGDRQSSLFGNQLRSGRAMLLSLFGAKSTGLQKEGLAWELVVLWGDF